MNPEERTWEVVRRAYAERPVQARRRSSLPLAAVAAVLVVAIVAAVLSPPGHAVFERVRRAVGVEHAAPALFALPAPGRLLVVSGQSAWVVSDNGLARRLGTFTDADWSPHGLYIVAAKANELLALDAHGNVRWTLARRGVSSPRWEGTRVDTRIAYFARSGLRIVAGDGTGDHLLDAHASSVPVAWEPGRLHTLAYVTPNAIVLRNADTGKVVWRKSIDVRATGLQWSTDGRLLAVLSAHRIIVLTAEGQTRRVIATLADRLLAGAFRPGTHQLAVSVRLPGRSEIRTVDVDRPGRSRLLFAGPGDFGDVAWSPDGRWLLVAWPTANQWLFVHRRTVRAVANIEQQFARSGSLEFANRWCCG